jgi:hypothetical protein
MSRQLSIQRQRHDGLYVNMFPLSDLFYLPLRIRKLKAPSPDRRFFLGSRILLRTFHSGVYAKLRLPHEPAVDHCNSGGQGRASHYEDDHPPENMIDLIMTVRLTPEGMNVRVDETHGEAKPRADNREVFYVPALPSFALVAHSTNAKT